MSRKRPHQWTCPIGPGCRHTVGIFIYTTDKALQKACAASDGGWGEAEAFCLTHLEDESDHIATLHFYRGRMTPDIVAHEVFHAVVELVRMLRLNLDDDDAQEVAAHSVSWLMEKVEEARRSIAGSPSKQP